MDFERYPIFEPGVSGESSTDRELLVGMQERAREYFASIDARSEVLECRIALGIGGVVALFLFQNRERTATGNTRYDWVVCGDLPSAAFGVEGNETGKLALETYCCLMDGWVKAVLEGEGLSEIYPVRAEPTQENARMLSSRLEIIRDEILASMDD